MRQGVLARAASRCAVGEGEGEGEVVAGGPGRVSDDGKRIEIEVKVGDIVIYSKYAGTELEDEGVEYLVLRESDLLVRVS